MASAIDEKKFYNFASRGYVIKLFTTLGYEFAK